MARKRLPGPRGPQGPQGPPGPGGGGTLTPLGGVVVLAAGSVGTLDGAYSGNQAYDVASAALAAVPAGGTIQVAPANYATIEPGGVSLPNLSCSIVGLGGRSDSNEARFPTTSWSVSTPRTYFLQRIHANLTGSQLVTFQARDSQLSSLNAACVANFAMADGTFDGYCNTFTGSFVGLGATTAVSNVFCQQCQVSGDVTAGGIALFTNTDFVGSHTITCPDIRCDAYSLKSAQDAGVTFTTAPTLLEGSSGIINQSSVSGSTVTAALNALLAAIAALVTGVSSVFGRTGAVVAATSDYDTDQVDNESTVPGSSTTDALDYVYSREVPFWSWSALDAGNSTSNRFLNQAGSNVTAASNEDGSIQISGMTGVLTSLYVRYGTALATANTTFTLRVNGVDTALTVTVNSGAQSGSITGQSVAVAAGDRVTIKSVTSAADATTSRPRATAMCVPQ